MKNRDDVAARSEGTLNRDRWRAINEIFHAALDVSPSSRKEFIAQASGGDSDLEAEVHLLLKADEDAGDYIETPLLPIDLFTSFPTGLRPGDMLCERFRIVRAVGEGGMGQVFEAFDAELGVQVALKVIRPEVASNAEALARFRQEVRLARRITHPNVCRTFDLERDTRGVDAESGAKRAFIFLTMEFLRGETLAARIKREGALPLDEALGLARQMASALDAAHALGVVHRDIKPANIMLIPADGPELRAVIMDFGLARVDGADALRSLSGISSKSNPIGTLAYMAPEQMSGGPVSPATDVYAFGLVLFEMATGQRAFPTESLLSGITQRLAGAPPDPAAIVPGLPRYWREAIQGCLDADPETRFQSAADGMAVLEGQRSGKHGIRAGQRNSWVRLRAWLKPRHVAAVVLTLVAAVTLFWGGLRYESRKASAKVAPGALVYLAPVKNETSEKAFDNLTELIQAGLSQSAQINLLDESRVGDTLERMTKAPNTVIDEPIAREIAMRTGAARVVFVEVSGSGGRYSLDVDMQQPDNTPLRPRRHWKNSFPWQGAASEGTNGAIPAELLAAVRDASGWIRQEVGESQSDIARLDVPPEDVTTGNWAALSDFVDASNLFTRGNPSGAIAELSQATEIDPSFALAFARMADIEYGVGREREGYDAYRRALDPSLSVRLTRKERDRIRGMFALDTMDFEESNAAFSDYSSFYEEDYFAWAYRCYPLKMLGRDGEAIEALRKAVRITPDAVFGPATLSSYLLIDGQYGEAEQWIDKVREMGYPDLALSVNGYLSFLKLNFDEAESDFSQLANSSKSSQKTKGNSLLGRLWAERGEFEKAIAILTTGAAQDRAQSNTQAEASKRIDISYLKMQMHQDAQSSEALKEALDLDSNSSPYLLFNGLDIVDEIGARNKSPQYRKQLEDILGTIASRVHPDDASVQATILTSRIAATRAILQGNLAAAEKLMQRAEQLMPPASPRTPFAAIHLAASTGGDHESSLREKTLAMADYQSVADRPSFIWHEPLAFPPGYFFVNAQAYLQIGRDLGRSNESTAVCEERIRKSTYATRPRPPK